MNRTIFFGLFLAFFWVFQMAEMAQQPTYFRFYGRRLVCTNHNEDLIYNLTCSLKKYSRTKETWNADVFLAPGVIIDNMMVKWSLYYKATTEYKKYVVIDSREDFCRFLKNNTDSIYLYVIKKMIDFGNFQHCPFKDRLYLKDFELDFSNFPPIFPHGDFYSNVLFYTVRNDTEVKLVDFRPYARVEPKTKYQF